MNAEGIEGIRRQIKDLLSAGRWCVEHSGTPPTWDENEILALLDHAVRPTSKEQRDLVEWLCKWFGCFFKGGIWSAQDARNYQRVCTLLNWQALISIKERKEMLEHFVCAWSGKDYEPPCDYKECSEFKSGRCVEIRDKVRTLIEHAPEPIRVSRK